MKRSDMLIKLYNEVDKFLEDDFTYHRENLVDFILDKVEELGMMPPKVYKGDYLTHDEYEWESEDGE